MNKPVEVYSDTDGVIGIAIDQTTPAFKIIPMNSGTFGVLPMSVDDMIELGIDILRVAQIAKHQQ